ncbi:uncharacterized protein TNCV_4903641 [Trichonephila clavipes]|uniref:Transposase Tc1-like domain-containing protein n=1 Tax=Trichonephila clavipes TaxID=2585209 RepID=A0A8X6SD70_TRICX|nr:uncharacterized protein TNCV_4903641 [Trichonephila clavipes]
MAKFSYLPENKRYKIIHLKEEGYSMSQIAAKVPCDLSTVVRTLKRFSETNFIVDRGTVRGRLPEIGLRGCKARPKPLLTEFQRKRRLTWTREHSLWTIKDWDKVIFSDESQFCISGNQSSAYVRRRSHEEFSPQCLKPTVKYPTKVMVWGCMSSHGVGRLHIVSGTDVAGWVKAFRLDWNEIVDLQSTVRLSIPQGQIDILSGLLYIDRGGTVRELSFGWSYSLKGMAHNEEMSEHEKNCYPQASISTHRSIEKVTRMHWLTSSTWRDTTKKETHFSLSRHKRCHS